MKKGLLKNVGKVLGLSLLASAPVMAAETAQNNYGGADGAAAAVGSILANSKKIIQGGAVLAALYGGYKVLLEGAGSGMHWFLLLVGGAMAGAYDTLASLIVGFFKQV